MYLVVHSIIVIYFILRKVFDRIGYKLKFQTRVRGTRKFSLAPWVIACEGRFPINHSFFTFVCERGYKIYLSWKNT